MFGRRQYYALVAGLKEHALETAGAGGGSVASGGKDFDAREIYADIRRELSPDDRRAAGLLLSLADIAGLSRARIEWLYDKCARSKSPFLREWGRFDRNLRNVIAAYTARAKGWPVADALLEVGAGGDSDVRSGSDVEDDVVLSLSRSSAADFGLKGDLEYIDSLLSTLDNEVNIVEKERTIDIIRWNKADELSEFDYFNGDAILAYLVKINIIQRWMALDPVAGREMFDRLVAGMKNGNAE